MAVLMGSVPAGLTFQDLVGGPAPRTSDTPNRDQSDRAAPRDRLMRIRVPDGVVQDMPLPQHQEFSATYCFTHASRDGVEDISEAA
jgi:hypothetical protein